MMELLFWGIDASKLGRIGNVPYTDLKGKQFFIASYRPYDWCFGPKVSKCRAKIWCTKSRKGERELRQERGWVPE